LFKLLLKKVAAQHILKDSSLTPSIPTDFADPSIIAVNGTWHAFATNAYGRHIQHARSADFLRWTDVNVHDVLPVLPGWVHAAYPNIWAPSVVRADDGRFVMYFSAAVEAVPTIHCVGSAVAESVTGPYVPSEVPFACPISAGGAIDPAGFRDADGTRYVLYKVDGNAFGRGGACNNGIPPLKPTPILLQRVAGDGLTKRGGVIRLLDRDGLDGPLVEAPSLAQVGGAYVLFYSSNCFDSPAYDVRVAVADSVEGPYRKRDVLMESGDFGLVAPGGADVADGGEYMAFHAGRIGRRLMYTAKLSSNGTLVTACASGMCKAVS
jgi:beta-xylosidase